MEKKTFKIISAIFLLLSFICACQLGDENTDGGIPNHHTSEKPITTHDGSSIQTTVNKAKKIIPKLTYKKNYTLIITEKINSDDIKEIGKILQKNSDKSINLDLSQSRGLLQIDENCFSQCKSLISIKLPATITSISYSAFSECTNLQNITVPDSVTSIRMGAFSDCIRLQSIKIPDNATLDREIFYNCHSLKTFEVSNKSKNFCTDETKAMLLSKDKKQLIAYPSASGSINIPDYITSIADFAFSGCCNLENINFHNHIASIGESAFYDCQNLTFINLPDSVEQINDGAFSDCENLTSIKLPANITSINKETFHGCKSLKNITLPTRLESIGEEAFYECENLENITLPDTIKTIGKSAFYNCENLKILLLPDSLISIDSSAFSNCQKLESIKLPKLLTSIKRFTFKDCENLQSLTICKKLTSIENGAFMNCNKLTVINYEGTKSDWDKMIKKDLKNNEILSKVTINYNYTAK